MVAGAADDVVTGEVDGVAAAAGVERDEAVVADNVGAAVDEFGNQAW